eukprot:scaffold630211_cov38-Prasinocladus_malaysianus.AAC.1
MVGIRCYKYYHHYSKQYFAVVIFIVTSPVIVAGINSFTAFYYNTVVVEGTVMTATRRQLEL